MLAVHPQGAGHRGWHSVGEADSLPSAAKVFVPSPLCSLKAAETEIEGAEFLVAVPGPGCGHQLAASPARAEGEADSFISRHKEGFFVART